MRESSTDPLPRLQSSPSRGPRHFFFALSRHHRQPGRRYSLSVSSLQALAVEASSLLKAGQLDRAYALAQTILAAAPRAAQAQELACHIARAQGRLAVAVEHARLAHEAAPDRPHLASNLGGLLTQVGRVAEAVAVLEAAAIRFPSDADVSTNLAIACLKIHRPTCAQAAADNATRLAPGNIPAILLRATASMTLGNVGSALDDLDRGLNIAPHDATLLTTRAAYGLAAPLSDAEHAAHHARSAAAFTDVRPIPRTPHLPPRAGTPLRVGLISPDLRTHSVAYFIAPLLEHLDPGSASLFIYHTSAISDGTTARLRQLGRGEPHTWRDAAALNDEQLAALIASDELDVLIELSGYTTGHRMGVLARRPAPIQLTYLGYPHATHAPFIDARLVDTTTDPSAIPLESVTPDTLRAPRARGAAEPLIAIDPCFLAYFPPPDAPAIEAAPQGRPLTFGCFGTLQKCDQPTKWLWAKALEAVPGSRLLLKSQAFADPRARDRVAASLSTFGIDPARLTLAPFAPGTAAHLARYHEVDIALDTFPYHGTTTTCEALYMGVPTITLVGYSHVSRVGLTLLKAVGLADLATAAPEAFVDAAVALAAETERRRMLRQTLRARLASSALGDHCAFAARFTRVLRAMVTTG